jgi:cystathionine gamma-lyase
MVPIYQTSTYVQESPGEHKGYEYSRTQNPTRNALEICLASLENARYGLAFASGCAATTTVLTALKAGDHVISCDDIYGGTRRLFSQVLSGLGLSFSYIDMTDPAALDEAIQPNTKLVWLETPTNPMLKILDIEKIAERTHLAGLTLVVDNTFMTPYFQQPLSLGADIVVHSTTKYLNGHSDVIGGFVATDNSDWAEKLAFLHNSIGAVPGPLDCFLVMRGVKTLGVRMRQHQKNAIAIAEYLSGHRQVKNVIYPGLSTHPQHQLALRQMSGFGGIISVELDASIEAVCQVLKRTKIFALAESLGGVESLIEHPAIMTHASIEKEVRESLGIGDGLIRLSVGIENTEDLISDLEYSLKNL